MYRYIHDNLKPSQVNLATEIMFGNLCDRYSFPSNYKIDCATYADGILTKGALTVFKYYENLLRENLDTYIRSNLTITASTFNSESLNIPSTLTRITN